MTFIFVANSGGHLQELHTLVSDWRRINGTLACRWVTDRNPHSESLLEAETTYWIDPSPPRSIVPVVLNSTSIDQILAGNVGSVEGVVTTGASMGLSAIVPAVRRRLRTVFIESATRISGPSMSGRIVQRVPGVIRINQSQQWPVTSKWKFGGSIFDEWSSAPTAPKHEIRRMVVSLGTQGGYGARKLVERVLEVVPSGVEIMWQTGATDISGLDLNARPFIPFAKMGEAMERADVVVCHAGVGSVLTALQHGHIPIVLPRSGREAEHVDEHQSELARDLSGRRLAFCVRPDELATSHLFEAMRSKPIRRVTGRPQAAISMALNGEL